ncbi:hypothetical protein APU90_08595 [Rathayibacter toxicus]|nr:hypothetical protein APU90_08595 [Rathayibacter toxicus]
METGGTKVVCALARREDPRRILRRAVLPTTGPEKTLAGIAAFLRDVGEPLAAVGVASFGPLEVDARSPNFGRITVTPKRGWEGVDLLGAVAAAAPGARTALVTDVNGAALAEGRWGAAVGERDCVYLTVGTGVGAGVLSGGRLLAGSGWPEVAHIPVRRHPEDIFAGVCRFHGDCLEGLVSGPAIISRWGTHGSALDPERARRNVALSAFYLAQLLATLTYTLGSTLAIVGGGVAKTPGLLARTEAEAHRLLGPAGATGTSVARTRVVPPALGDDAGVLGALALADEVADSP